MACGNALKFRRLRVVADGLRDTHGLEVVAQNVLLLGRGTFVYPEQPRVLALANEICRAHVGREHRLFNQLVSVVAGARHDLLDAAGLVADDLRLHGLEVHRAANIARSQQRAIDIVQIER